MATSNKSYDNQALNSTLDLHSEEYTYNVTRNTADKVITNYDVAVFTNSEYGSMIIKDGKKESDEENEKYVVEDDAVVEKRENKNNSNMTSPTKRIGSYKIKQT